ncbi:MAG: phospholipid-binding protein [Herbaspirillum sp.]|jgi:Raf kinase inhibitor-like YbhB/YbcL family protein|nr:phospholipid-binding protein [Herbaspirillum sp.]
MQIYSDSFQDGAFIPVQFAFAKADPASHIVLSDNRNPHLAWSGVPGGVKSFAVICHDPDVPSAGDDVNQEGKTVPANLRRVDFCHWVLVDLLPTASAVAEAQFSRGVTPRGKAGPEITGDLAPLRQGVNDYTGWFAGDKDMSGDYFGYDGPCPPWNDALMHHYIFTVYALDLVRLPVDGKFTRADALAAMQGHILAQASLTGLYTLNPALAPK